MTRVNLSIDVPNLDEGVRFYTEVFGFIETSRPFATMAVLDANNVAICIHEKAADSKPSPNTDDVRRYNRHWTPVHADFHVDDFDAVLALAQQAGATVDETFRIPDRPAVAFCGDPFGNGFCLIENSR